MSNRIAERELIDRMQAGDGAAVAELATAYAPRIYQLAFRYVRNHEDAEEITQDVLLKVYRTIRAFRGDAALSSWIYRITFNAAMSRLRHGRPRASAEQGGAPCANTSAEPADWSMLGDEHVFRLQLRRRLMAAVRQLPAIYRTPVVLRDVHGMSTEEASARLQVKTQTLKSRLHRGRTILREQLQAFADGLSLHRAAC